MRRALTCLAQGCAPPPAGDLSGGFCAGDGGEGELAVLLSSLLVVLTLETCSSTRASSPGGPGFAASICPRRSASTAARRCWASWPPMSVRAFAALPRHRLAADAPGQWTRSAGLGLSTRATASSGSSSCGSPLQAAPSFAQRRIWISTSCSSRRPPSTTTSGARGASEARRRRDCERRSAATKNEEQKIEFLVSKYTTHRRRLSASLFSDGRASSPEPVRGARPG